MVASYGQGKIGGSLLGLHGAVGGGHVAGSQDVGAEIPRILRIVEWISHESFARFQYLIVTRKHRLNHLEWILEKFQQQLSKG